MIDHDQLVLRFIRNLRKVKTSHAIPQQLKSHYSDNPAAQRLIIKRLFRTLSEELLISSCVVYRPSKTRTNWVGTKVFGKRGIWKQIEKENIELQGNYKTKLLIPLTPPVKNINRKYLPIGYIGFSRIAKFSLEEKAVLSEIADHYSDYLYEVMLTRTMLESQKAISFIFQCIKKYDKAGTIVASVHGKMHRVLSSWYSQFGIIQGNKIYFEYYQYSYRTRPGCISEIIPQTMPESLIKELYQNDYFVWMDLDGELSFSKELAEKSSREKNNWIYFFLVYKHERNPIAVSIFQFKKNEMTFLDVHHELFRIAQTESNRSVGHLFQRRSNNMIVNPIYKYRDTIIDEKLVFIIMPFSESWSDRIWSKILRPIIESNGLKPKRADDLYGRDIMEDIWSGIVASKIVIADITSRNANVFYELGIAHTLGKDVILLSQSVEDIPFDLNRYRHIIYEDNFDGYETLEKQLYHTISQLI